MSNMLLDKVMSDLDKEKMYLQISSFAADCAKAWQDAQQFTIPRDYSTCKKVVLLGMGGSGIANEMIKELLFEKSLCIEVVHDYQIPGFVDETTLVIASSYSGNTEEVLTAFKSARKLGAKIVAITTGGELKALVEENGIPYLTFNYPSQPRMAFPYLFTYSVYIFAKLGLYPEGGEFGEVCKKIENTTRLFGIDSPTEKNLAKQIAIKLKNRMPIIYASPLLKSVGVRFKTLINETSNNYAFAESFPELNHNAIEGFSFPVSLPATVLQLHSRFDTDRIKKRQEITKDILERSGISNIQINLEDLDTSLAEHLAYVSLADSVAYYLAILNGTNPTAIPNINYLKQNL